MVMVQKKMFEDEFGSICVYIHGIGKTGGIIYYMLYMNEWYILFVMYREFLALM